VHDAANYLRVHPRTVTRTNLPSVLIGRARRYRPEDVRGYVDANCLSPFGVGSAR
jgi:hypothetical protein